MNDRQYRLLVVDDDSRLRDLLVRYLGDQGFEVKAVGDAGQMDRTRTREHFDLIVLDLMLPGEDGLSICRRLRGTGDTTPIIMESADGAFSGQTIVRGLAIRTDHETTAARLKELEQAEEAALERLRRDLDEAARWRRRVPWVWAGAVVAGLVLAVSLNTLL